MGFLQEMRHDLLWRKQVYQVADIVHIGILESETATRMTTAKQDLQDADRAPILLLRKLRKLWFETRVTVKALILTLEILRHCDAVLDLAGCYP